MGSTQTVAVGRIVHFVHDAHTAQQAKELGGNRVEPGTVEPAIIVRTWEDSASIQLKVFRDGPKDLWVTSVMPEPRGDLLEGGPIGPEAMNVVFTQRTWHWPPRLP